MTKAQFRVLMLLTVISGLVGGGLSDLLFRGLPARAAGTTTAPKVIQAQEFRLVDAAGTVRGRFGFDMFGTPELGLNDASGKWRLYLTAQPGLQLADATGRWRGGLRLAEDGTLGVRLGDGAGTGRAWLGLSKEGTPWLGLYDAKGQSIWDAP